MSVTRPQSATRRGGVPPSFGRPAAAEQEPDDFRIVGGRATMPIQIDVSDQVLAALYWRIRNTVEHAVRDGYAAAVGEQLPPPEPGGAGEEQPAGVDGGAPAG